MIKVEGIFFSQSGFTLNIPRLAFPKSGMTCLWGPSGAGKSTLLQILAGIIPCPTLRWDLAGRNLGYVFQDFRLFPHMTVWENVTAPARAQGLHKSAYEKHALDLLDRLGVLPIKDRKARVLSGGEQQRVALARALVAKPAIVFMDEPFSSLNQVLRTEARILVKRISEEASVPFVFVTHDISDIRSLAQYLLFIEDGKLKASGKVSDLLENPKNLALARQIPYFQVLPNDVLNLAPEGKTVLAKNWSFEIIGAGDGLYSERDFTVDDIIEEGHYRLCYITLKGAVKLKAISYLSVNDIRASGNRIKVHTHTLTSVFEEQK